MFIEQNGHNVDAELLIEDEIKNQFKTENPFADRFIEAAIHSNEESEDGLSELLLHDAIASSTSDIHIDPFRDRTTIRFRINGLLQNAATIPAELAQKVINQLKVRGKLPPMNSPLPCESRFSIELMEQHVDVRITSIQSHFGEKMHIRLLLNEDQNYCVEDLQLDDDLFQELTGWLREPTGICLVTGPTGAGKTTTLHAIAREFVRRNQNVITIEEPVEYELDGATQIQVDEGSELNFQTGIRSALRMDPDCILVGELRDPKSVATALTASASGHTVLTALHSRNVVDAITVLRRWGAKNGPLSSQLGVVMNQRLYPRLCQNCRFERLPTGFEKLWFEQRDVAVPEQVFDARGCEQCRQTRFRGRVSNFELWKPTESDREMIASGASVADLQKAIVDRGFRNIDQRLMDQVRIGDVLVPVEN